MTTIKILTLLSIECGHKWFKDNTHEQNNETEKQANNQHHCIDSNNNKGVGEKYLTNLANCLLLITSKLTNIKNSKSFAINIMLLNNHTGKLHADVIV